MKKIFVINFFLLLLTGGGNTAFSKENNAFCIDPIHFSSKLTGDHITSEFQNVEFSDPMSVRTFDGEYPILVDTLSAHNKAKSDRQVSALWGLTSDAIWGPYFLDETTSYTPYASASETMLFLDMPKSAQGKSNLINFKAGKPPTFMAPEIVSKIKPPKMMMSSQILAGIIIVSYEGSSMDGTICVPVADDSCKAVDQKDATINLYKDGKIETLVDAVPRVTGGQELIQNNVILFTRDNKLFFLDKNSQFSSGPRFWPSNSVGEFFEMNESGWVYMRDNMDQFENMIHLIETDKGIVADKNIQIQIMEDQNPPPIHVNFSNDGLDELEIDTKKSLNIDGFLKIGDYRQFSKSLGHMITKNPMAQITPEGIVPIPFSQEDPFIRYIGDITDKRLAIFIGRSGRMYSYDGKVITAFTGDRINEGSIVNVSNSHRVFFQNDLGLYEWQLSEGNVITPKKLLGADIYQNQNYTKTPNSYTPISIIKLTKTDDVLILGFSGIFQERQGQLVEIWSPPEYERLGNPTAVHHINNPEEIIFNTQTFSGNITNKSFYRIYACSKK